MAKKKSPPATRARRSKKPSESSKHPQLKLVRLIESSSRLHIENNDLPKSFEIGMNIKSKNSDDEKSVMSLVSIKANGKATGTEVTITASLELAYDSAPMSDEKLVEFQRTIAADAWPYLAEFLRNISSRMMIAPIYLPPLKENEHLVMEHSISAAAKPKNK